MNYVIGHGLYIKVIDLKTLGGFPEDTINEDACLGYLLNCNNIKIIPIPFLEKAESPNKVSIYIKQQTTWFNGPWYAFQYWKCKMKAQGKTMCGIYYWLLNYFACAILVARANSPIVYMSNMHNESVSTWFMDRDRFVISTHYAFYCREKHRIS